MINVKGTKNASPETDASQRYVLKSGDEVSRTTLVVAGLLTGIAAYLSSIFSWGRERKPESEPEEPIAGAAEIESPELMGDEADSPQKPPKLPDAEPHSETMPSVVDMPRSTPLRYPGEGEIAPLVGGAASGNAVEIGRVGGSVGTPLSYMAHPGINRPPLSLNDVPPAIVNDAWDSDSSSAGEPIETEGEDDTDSRPDVNRSPRVSGPVYLLDVAPCVALLIAFDDLLRNAVDPDGDVLSVQNMAVSSGTLTQAEGGWIFQSDSGQLGPVMLTYQITDGELTTDAVALFSVVEPPAIEGTAANDTFLGSLCADEIDGAGGDDNIDGRAGDDVLNGGAGDDHIVAGDGDDVVFGGDGNDMIFGGAGNDHLFGGSGDDRLFGGDGDDVIFGNDGNDRLSGGNGDDLLLGGDGSDVFFDGAGRDKVFGGMGNDWVVAALDGDDDVYDGGGNSDTLDYSHASQGLVVDLINGVASGVEIGHDAISGFEKVLGGQGADHFTFGSGPATLTGGNGDDVFVFASVSDERPNTASYTIMDFGVGDRIRLSQYEIFWQEDQEQHGHFEQIYHGNDDDDSPIRYRHDRDDGNEWTVIETDFEDDGGMWETAVTLQGIKNLSWSKERDDGLEWLS
ncbi:cadherin-like domain-containing protein [Halomonas sp. A40-4]|uniref:calcium-binding protein n=1 Tax=Halomonas sp. A40-4 TaxID=2785909 RepID=UPI0018EF7188|nr:cadherin-like domain-containing protein [Halomonas sp. A40-4]QPL47956.1 cadherin-like domain-containing protein [Halomonas sp. A40-4]